ncbi:bifunctional tRNA pseudouridine(32) synthase/23S rRNA pseudouridine(746) synthase RluA [Pseudoalteromonas xiamenensis]|uniref:bifunctional tRNA pseudouridine(32) synthase/23S rRNA pseudouridine(746) synthase RluA n=1 Tax=Pseudoalteromonas xiamenensis TaxID=882626 RepID=UPI0027E42024|nr:bifunctional tRNA pseudouridine(32) synthase/23S rRNA pseudouridine(746) synthase RluA [Pseudoalteromonas xiamenensis]WMN59155.1 bifunctional tRNA pseudouridine(32) synthase/23S rRNA pseudouridine(746) synthase RluA [Pseudoalteromonas xiamenensis]
MLLHYHPPLDPYLSFLYQDDDILIIDKPNGLLTVPGKDPAHSDSAITRVNRVFPSARIVHRLDMATSGILCIAMNKAAHRDLSIQFQDRKTAKRYVARVLGHIKDEQGSVEEPLICDWPNRPKQKICYETGKPSLTHWQVIKREESATRVALTPITGRSHQLRVHMQSIGHPILGDKFYATPEGLAMAPRLQLHAEMLQITHPVTKELLTFTCCAPF